MVQLEGKYAHQRNENLDEYFKALGCPYILRKVLCSSSPYLEIYKNGEEWTIEEVMPVGHLKINTTLEGDKLVTKSVGPNNTNISRIYEFSNDGCIIVPKMVQIEGKYTHQKNENLDEYFKALGVPYIPRKMMCSTSPSLEINKSDEEWTITIATLLKTTVSNFKLGEEYEETMPGGTLKNNTILEGDKLITKSIGPNNTNISRIYEFSDDGCVVIYKHETSGVEAKRYFKRT